MKSNVLVLDSEKYGGQFVAKGSFTDVSVVAFGADPVAVSDEARKKGYTDPVIVYIPEKDMVHIY